MAGTFVYSPAAGTVLTAGSQTLSVTFTPTDTTDYNAATATVTLTVNTPTATITWATPAAITYGTALSATQLNATSSVAGTFVYTPAAGTVLTAGSQTLSVTFTPTDTTDYTSATATVTTHGEQGDAHHYMGHAGSNQLRNGTERNAARRSLSDGWHICLFPCLRRGVDGGNAPPLGHSSPRPTPPTTQPLRPLSRWR